MNIEQILAVATRDIGSSYFQLPVDGQENHIYRERVYCYELYHQLRLHWPDDTEYELSGEVDKSGHRLVRGNNLDRVKPDLLVHVPGDMGGNRTIIEVKPITAKKIGIKKDLETLTAFRLHGQYQKAIYLFYGLGNFGVVNSKISEVVAQANENEIALDLIELWWHRAVDTPAIKQAVQFSK